MTSQRNLIFAGAAGQLEGVLHLPDLAPRGIAVVAHPLPVMRGEFPELPLLLAGFSFGAYVQARAAEKLQPQHAVLVAPAVGRYAMPKVAANTLLIHGDLDEVVPLPELLEWARPQHLPVIVLAGAEHFFHGRLTQLKQIVLQHFNGIPK